MMNKKEKLVDSLSPDVGVARDARGVHFVFGRTKVYIDFQRRNDIGTKNDLLAKAIGHKKGVQLRIFDVTAGLCRDSYHFACLGHAVTAFEKNNLIYKVVSERLQEQQNNVPLHLELIHANATTVLPSLSELPDVIYLDPMFPEKKKSAKPGKESELLKLVVGGSIDDEESRLFTLALASAKKRVVVKRPRLAAPLVSESKDIKPSRQIIGKSVRYDIYLIPPTRPS